MADIRWQLDKPQRMGCPQPTSRWPEQCSGDWVEVAGGFDGTRRGWLWTCIGTDCPNRVVAQ